jgi:hypothetical protein
MSAERLFDLTVLIVLVVLAARLVPSASRILRMYLTIRSRRLQDATSDAPPEPAAVTAVATALEPLGFSRIGVRSAELPGIGRRFEWNLVDAPTTTYVSIVPSTALRTGFLLAAYSAFADGAFLSTHFPSGATVHRPDLDSVPAGTTPSDAVLAHRQRLSNFSAAHGPALQNRTMADLLARDDTYRRRHGGATIRTRVYLYVGITALVVVAAAIELLRVVVLDA